MLGARNDSNYNGFGEPMDLASKNMTIKPKEFQCFLEAMDLASKKMSIKPKELQWFWRDEKR